MVSSNIMSDEFKALLFDLDGTLLDSFSVHYETYKIIFARFGIQTTKEKFLSTYSPNWYQTYEAMGLPKENWNSANSYWVEEAEKRTSELFPGVRETLTKLFESYALGLVTSGSKSRVMKDLKRTGIGHLFTSVVTGDDIHKPKPSPEGLELALLDLRVQPNEAVYIGDAYADYEMAQAAGVSFIGVRSAFTNLNSNDPSYRVYPITDLPSLLRV